MGVIISSGHHDDREMASEPERCQVPGSIKPFSEVVVHVFFDIDIL